MPGNLQNHQSLKLNHAKWGLSCPCTDEDTLAANAGVAAALAGVAEL